MFEKIRKKAFFKKNFIKKRINYFLNFFFKNKTIFLRSPQRRLIKEKIKKSDHEDSRPKQKTNIGKTRKNDHARRKTHEGKMIKEKMMIEKKEKCRKKGSIQNRVFGRKKENRKRKLNKSLQRFKNVKKGYRWR